MSFENILGRRTLILGALAAAGSGAAKCAGIKDTGRASKSIIRSLEDLERACAVGGKHTIMPGTYVLGDKVLRPVTGTHLTGTPGRTILQKKTSPGPYRTRPFFDIEDGKDIVLEGLEFRYLSKRFEMAVIVRATSLASAGRVDVRHCVFGRCYIYIQRYVDTVRIEQNRFLLDGVVGGIGMGGEISKTSGRGLNLNGLVNNILIRNNYFEEARTEAIDVNWHSQNITIDKNYCYNCNTDNMNEVIDVGGDVNTTRANQCRNIIITSNKIVNDFPGRTSTIGIHVKGRSTDILVERNTIIRTRATGGVGIRIWNADRTTIRGNTISGYGYGIATTDAGENLPEQCHILNNIVRNYAIDGIELRGRNFSVIGNEIDGTGSTGNGIDLVNLNQSVIRGNKVANSAARGIRRRSRRPN